MGVLFVVDTGLPKTCLVLGHLTHVEAPVSVDFVLCDAWDSRIITCFFNLASKRGDWNARLACGDLMLVLSTNMTFRVFPFGASWQWQEAYISKSRRTASYIQNPFCITSNVPAEKVILLCCLLRLGCFASKSKQWGRRFVVVWDAELESLHRACSRCCR